MGLDAEFAGELTAESRAQVEGWFAQCAARPGALPDGCEPVQVRRIRAVGRARLPDGAWAYLKVMAFPHFRNRLRYLFRALPAVHEARMLTRLRAAAPDVRCPEVLGVAGSRKLGVPRLAVLVTRGLPHAAEPLSFRAITEVARRVAEVGLFHPDLNRGNFVRQPDGEHAILDFQSARWRSSGVRSRERRRMAAKILADWGELGEPQTLVRGGLIAGADLVDVRARAERLVVQSRRTRLLRCLAESSEFRTQRRWNGVLFERRVRPPESRPVVGGREFVDLWLADRVRELWCGRKPLLHGLFRESWWCGRRNTLYIPAACGPDEWARAEAVLARAIPLARAVLRRQWPVGAAEGVCGDEFE